MMPPPQQRPLLNLPHTPIEAPVANAQTVGERGEWDVIDLDPQFYPALQCSLPMKLIYKRVGREWVPWVLAAESALLRRAGVRRGLGQGLFALRRFAVDDEIGRYGGKVMARGQTRAEADAAARPLVLQGASYLLTMRVQGVSGWLVVDGSTNPVRPFLHLVNDPRGTRLAPRCIVTEFGNFKARMVTPALDWSRPLQQQWQSELSFEYQAEYWSIHDRLGTSQLPLEVESTIESMQRLDLDPIDVHHHSKRPLLPSSSSSSSASTSQSLAACMLSALENGPPNLDTWAAWATTASDAAASIFINGKSDAWRVPATFTTARGAQHRVGAGEHRRGDDGDARARVRGVCTATRDAPLLALCHRVGRRDTTAHAQRNDDGAVDFG